MGMTRLCAAEQCNLQALNGSWCPEHQQDRVPGYLSMELWEAASRALESAQRDEHVDETCHMVTDPLTGKQHRADFEFTYLDSGQAAGKFTTYPTEDGEPYVWIEPDCA